MRYNSNEIGSYRFADTYLKWIFIVIYDFYFYLVVSKLCSGYELKIIASV